MKLVKMILVASAFAGFSAHASTNANAKVDKSNSTCAHSPKNDSWTRTASNDYAGTVFNDAARAQRTVPQTTPNSTR